MKEATRGLLFQKMKKKLSEKELRALKRKRDRNFLAKKTRENKQYRERYIEDKKRKPQNIEQYLKEYDDTHLFDTQ